ETGVTQSPTHLIKTRGQQVTLRCSPQSGHNTVSWYQQTLGQGPQFIVQYYREEENGRGNFPPRFSGRQFPDYSSELNVNASLLEDSALYLCASSLAQPGRVTDILYINFLP
uniref:Ig-like domain-containing protein n=1 Tax=Nomascus leucogenys TaxID=61853 RepID=A0A2I3G0H6_NOMLE